MPQRNRVCLFFFKTALWCFFFHICLLGNASAFEMSVRGSLWQDFSVQTSSSQDFSLSLADQREKTENLFVASPMTVSFQDNEQSGPANRLGNDVNRGMGTELVGGVCPLGDFHEEGNHSSLCVEEPAVHDTKDLFGFDPHPYERAVPQDPLARGVNGQANMVQGNAGQASSVHTSAVQVDAVQAHVIQNDDVQTAVFQGDESEEKNLASGATKARIMDYGPEISDDSATFEIVEALPEHTIVDGVDVESATPALQRNTFQNKNLRKGSLADDEQVADFVNSLLAEMPLAEKVGQLIMVGFRGTGEGPDSALEKVMGGIHQGKIGGVILFDYDVSTQNPVRNIVSLEQVGRLTRQLQNVAPLPLFVGIDQEGGRVARLKEAHGMPELASPKFLGSGPVEVSFETYSGAAKILAEVGVNVNFAPSVDVDVDPLAPAIGKLGRAYSAEPEIVTQHAEAFAKALENHGLIAAFKHFPGHGSAANDTHLGLADVTETWEGQELEPYRDLLPKHPQAMVMVGHVFHKMFDETYPASLSKNIITEILRKDIGWEGLVITDDLDMQAISNYYSVKECAGLALNAGVDILLFGNNLQYDPELFEKLFQGVMDLVEEGEVSEERIEEACGRVLRAKYSLYPNYL